MTLTTYRPANPTLWNAFDDFFHWAPEENAAISPRTRVSEDEKGYNVRMELPGVKKEDLKVEVENGVLTVSALKQYEKKDEGKGVYLNEITYGEYKRSFRISDEVETDKVDAHYLDGVLNLSLTKKEKAKPKQIDIK